MSSAFYEHIVRCEQAGIAKEKLLLDPGFGFGKNLSHNYQLLATGRVSSLWSAAAGRYVA
jgi:dihydropteroate synthase